MEKDLGGDWGGEQGGVPGGHNAIWSERVSGREALADTVDFYKKNSFTEVWLTYTKPHILGHFRFWRTQSTPRKPLPQPG